MAENDKEFRFKKFNIKHGINSLPITTEALIFGGILADKCLKVNLALEIGTGCGILPIMIAQKNRTQIHTVEIDENAFELALENVQKSNFANQISVFHTDIHFFNSFIGEFESEKYALIISNPPFFQNHLKGKNVLQNMAKHNDTLPFDKLAKQVNRLLHIDGQFFVLLPPYELGLLTSELIKYNLFKNDEISISHCENSKVLRIIATFAFQVANFREANFIIKNNANEYTAQFKSLLKDYYLIF